MTESAHDAGRASSMTGPDVVATGAIARLFRSALRSFLRGLAFGIIAIVLLWGVHDYRPTETEAAIASYRFNLLSWELGNITDKWHRQLNDLLLGIRHCPGMSASPWPKNSSSWGRN